MQISLFDLKSENIYFKKDLNKIFDEICCTVEYMSYDMLCLPIYPELTGQQQDYIINAIKFFFEK